MTTGQQGYWSKGNAAASAGAAGPFYGTTGRRKQQVAAAELSVPQDLSKDHGPTGSSGRRRPFQRGRSTFRGTTGRDGSAGWLCMLRQMQQQELWRAVGTHYAGPTWIYGPTGHAFGGTAQQALRELLPQSPQPGLGTICLKFEPVVVDARSCDSTWTSLHLHRWFWSW